MTSIFDQIKADREAGMPELGGWAWFGGRDDLYLATNRGGRRYVMGFKRKGMRSAQPTFQIGGIMYGAIDDLTEYEVGDGSARGQAQADADTSVYRMDVKSVDHPDARRIARVPQLERIALAAEDNDAMFEDIRDCLNGVLNTLRPGPDGEGQDEIDVLKAIISDCETHMAKHAEACK